MKRRSIRLILLAAVLSVLLLALAGCATEPVSSEQQLIDALAAEGTKSISLDENLIITEPLIINGEKTIIGSGTITLNVTPPEDNTPSAPPSLLGCPIVGSTDLSNATAALQVSEGASLTLSGTVTVDAAQCGVGVVVKGSMTVTETATVKNGLGANIYICKDAKLSITGGSVTDAVDSGVVNHGAMTVSGGTLSGAEDAVILTSGTLEITDGSILDSKTHSIYVTGGSITMTGGTVGNAKRDGILLCSGATANVTGGTIENCGFHGLCNSGNMTAGAVVLNECGISNSATGILDMDSTVIEVSTTYCLANLGGKVTAKNFETKSCDTTAICNFAGDMVLTDLTVNGSRSGNISVESGSLTVQNATLGVCRQKPINVGGGVVKMDNVQVEGTTGEHFGAYIYGGEFYLSNSTIKFVNYSALRADGKCYVELDNIVIDDIMATGLWARGGTIVAKDITMTNVRGHGISNGGGDVTITNLTASDIGKNAITMDNGTTTLNNATFTNVGDQGAYLNKDSHLIINGGAFENVAQNGVYSRPGSTAVVELKDVTYNNITKYGLNNGYKLTAENVTLTNIGLSGILNKLTMDLKNVIVSGCAKDNIYNDTDGNLTVMQVWCCSPGSGSNPVYNRGNLYVYDLYITLSENYGVYNHALGHIQGDSLHISDVKKVGLYNVGGSVKNLKNLTTENTGDHGINNNKGTFQVTNLSIKNVLGEKSNAIYNTGDMNIQTLNVDGVVSHGVFNRGTVVADNVTIHNVGKVGFDNYIDGKAVLSNVNIYDVGDHGIYNISDMELTNATITSKTNGIFSRHEKAELAAPTLKLNGQIHLLSCGGHGLCNNGGTVSGASDILVQSVGGNAVYNAKGDVTLNNVTVSGSDYGISNAGTTTLAALNLSGTKDGGIHNSGTLTVNGSASISGVSRTTDGDNQGNGIYNTKNLTINGSLSIADITASGHTGNASNNAIFNRGTLVATGDVTIGEVAAGHAILCTAGSIDFPGTVTLAGNVGKDNLVYFYSGAKTGHFGNLVKTTDHKKVVLKIDGSTKLTVDNATLVGGSGKDVVVANGSALITLNNATITGGNNAIHGAGGDVTANNLTVSGSTIGINIRNKNSLITISGNVAIENTTHGSAIHVNSGGKLVLSGASARISWSGGTHNGVKIYNASTLELTGSSLTIESPKTGISLDAGAALVGDAASTLTVNNAAADGYILENNGTITFNGTVTGSAAAGDTAQYLMNGSATFGSLSNTAAVAREVLRADKGATVIIGGGSLLGSGKDVLVSCANSNIQADNLTITGGNNAIYGAGGSITVGNVTVSGATIGINIRNAASVITVAGHTTISGVNHDYAVHVNSGSTLSVVDGGKLEITPKNHGIKVYKDSTLDQSGGEIVIHNAKVGIYFDSNSKGVGSNGTITLNSPSDRGVHIQSPTVTVGHIVVNNCGNYGLNVTSAGKATVSSVTVNGMGENSTAVNNAGNATIGKVTVTGDTGKNAVKSSGGTVNIETVDISGGMGTEIGIIVANGGGVGIHGGTITSTAKKDVVTAQKGTVWATNVTVIGGNNAFYATGGNIDVNGCTVDGSTIGINIRNAASVVALLDQVTIRNTTHGTAIHVNSGGTLRLRNDTTLTVDAANSSTTVALKVYANSTLDFKEGTTLTVLGCTKVMNTDAGHIIEGRDNATITLNGEPA